MTSGNYTQSNYKQEELPVEFKVFLPVRHHAAVKEEKEQAKNVNREEVKEKKEETTIQCQEKKALNQCKEQVASDEASLGAV